MASTRIPTTTSFPSPSDAADLAVEAARDADVSGFDASTRDCGTRPTDSTTVLGAALPAAPLVAASVPPAAASSIAVSSVAASSVSASSVSASSVCASTAVAEPVRTAQTATLVPPFPAGPPASPVFALEPAQAGAAAARAGSAVLLYAGLTGTARLRNDDRWQVAADIGLLLVADGVSGYPAGNLAAELAVQTACQLVPDLLRHGLTPSEALGRAMVVCHDEIREFAAGRPDCAGMATTLVCALIHDGFLHLAHAGDSRAYLLRDGRLTRLTRDHCVGQQIVETGRLTEAQVAELPARGILTRALGLADRIDPELASLAWQANDTLLLCSDGLTEALSDPILEHLLLAASARGPAGQVRALIGGALQTGLAVNATALVATAVDRHSPGVGQDRPH